MQFPPPENPRNQQSFVNVCFVYQSEMINKLKKINAVKIFRYITCSDANKEARPTGMKTTPIMINAEMT